MGAGAAGEAGCMRLHELTCMPCFPHADLTDRSAKLAEDGDVDGSLAVVQQASELLGMDGYPP